MVNINQAAANQVEFPKRTKVLAIAILVLIMGFICALLEFLVHGVVTKSSIFNEFNAGAVIALIVSASCILNPFSRKCWI